MLSADGGLDWLGTATPWWVTPPSPLAALYIPVVTS
jgi:hypothetical protein